MREPCAGEAEIRPVGPASARAAVATLGPGIRCEGTGEAANETSALVHPRTPKSAGPPCLCHLPGSCLLSKRANTSPGQIPAVVRHRGNAGGRAATPCTAVRTAAGSSGSWAGWSHQALTVQVPRLGQRECHQPGSVDTVDTRSNSRDQHPRVQVPALPRASCTPVASSRPRWEQPPMEAHDPCTGPSCPPASLLPAHATLRRVQAGLSLNCTCSLGVIGVMGVLPLGYRLSGCRQTHSNEDVNNLPVRLSPTGKCEQAPLL